MPRNSFHSTRIPGTFASYGNTVNDKEIALALPSYPPVSMVIETYITERSSLGGTGLRTV